MSILDMLPEAYRASIYVDEEAAVRAYLDGVERLASQALGVAGLLGQWAEGDLARRADNLEAAARSVAPHVTEAT